MTSQLARVNIFAVEMRSFHCIAFTHQNYDLDAIGRFHIAEDKQEERLQHLKNKGVDEFLFLSTCNRVELWFRMDEELNESVLVNLLSSIYPTWDLSEIQNASEKALIFSHLEAVDHVFRVASSLDSLVIGEREILGQIRDAYENGKNWGFSQDFLRILIRKTIETAKRVYTETQIAAKPVSVVNLAYRLLDKQNHALDSRVLFIGSGKTNQALARKMQKVGYQNFSVFNRTKANAEKMVAQFGGMAYGLEDLKSYTGGFDILISCTGAEEQMLDLELFNQLVQEEKSAKTLIDLAIPYDIDATIKNEKFVHYISIEELKEIAARNLEARRGELEKCEAIISVCRHEFEEVQKVRKVELAMRKVPLQVKEIRQRATEVMFAEEIAEMDDKAKETLEKVLSFVEKKYMSTPMLLAKEILLNNEIK